MVIARYKKKKKTIYEISATPDRSLRRTQHQDTTRKIRREVKKDAKKYKKYAEECYKMRRESPRCKINRCAEGPRC